MLRNFISIAITSKEIDMNRPSNSQILISKESNGIHNNNEVVIKTIMIAITRLMIIIIIIAVLIVVIV